MQLNTPMAARPTMLRSTLKELKLITLRKSNMRRLRLPCLPPISKRSSD